MGKKGSKEAKRGTKSEKDFVNLVNNNKRFNTSLKKILNIEENLRADHEISNKVKADCYLVVESGQKMGVSIKEAEVDLNQLDRRWLKDLAEKHNMPQDIEDKLNECLIKKSRDSKGEKFIQDEYKDEILKYFTDNLDSILTDVFTRGDKNLKYFVVYDFSNNEWYIASMDKVIEEISIEELSTSDKGLIQIGNLITIKRKGGNGSHIKLDKDDPNHPGNNIQFQIKPLSLLKTGLFKKISQ